MFQPQLVRVFAPETTTENTATQSQWTPDPQLLSQDRFVLWLKMAEISLPPGQVPGVASDHATKRQRNTPRAARAWRPRLPESWKHASRTRRVQDAADNMSIFEG